MATTAEVQTSSKAAALAAQLTADLGRVEFIRYSTAAGGTQGILCVWPLEASKTDKAFAAQWGVIDGRTDSVTTMLARMVGELDAVVSDENLSLVGRRKKVHDRAVYWASLLEGPARRWLSARELAQDADKTLAGVDPYKTAAPWHQDLELARTVRALPDEERRALRLALELGEHGDLAQGLLRVPAFLTGLPVRSLDKIMAATLERKNPGYSCRRRLVDLTFNAAVDAIDKAVRYLESSQWAGSADELRALLGADVATVRLHAGRPVADTENSPEWVAPAVETA